MTHECAIERFKIIKDEKNRTTLHLQELEKILTCVYMQNEEQADKMWQYLVDKYDDTNSRRYYVIRLFRILTLPYDLQWKFISMHKKRIEILFANAYANTNISFKAYDVIRGYLELNRLSDAVEIIDYVKKYEKKMSVFDGVKLIVVNLTDTYHVDSKEVKEKKELFFEQCINRYAEDDFIPLFEMNLIIYKKNKQKEKIENSLAWMVESGICDAKYYSNRFIRDYFLILYRNRDIESEKEIIQFMELFCCKYTNSWMRYWSSPDVSDWIVSLSYKSTILFTHSLRTDRDFANDVIKASIREKKWKEVSEFISKTVASDSNIVNSSIFEHLDDTLKYLEDITEDEKTMDFNVQISEGVSIPITISIPKMIIHSPFCYDVDQDEIVQFCDAIIAGCEGIAKSEEIRKLENKAIYLKNKIVCKIGRTTMNNKINIDARVNSLGK